MITPFEMDWIWKIFSLLLDGFFFGWTQICVLDVNKILRNTLKGENYPSTLCMTNSVRPYNTFLQSQTWYDHNFSPLTIFNICIHSTFSRQSRKDGSGIKDLKRCHFTLLGKLRIKKKDIEKYDTKAYNYSYSQYKPS